MAKKRSTLKTRKRRTVVVSKTDPDPKKIARQHDIAKLIYRTRTAAGLTQLQLAQRVGTPSSVISRLEYATYDGQALVFLERIADALNLKMEIRLRTAKP